MFLFPVPFPIYVIRQLCGCGGRSPRQRQGRWEEGADGLHQQSAAGAGEGVPLQPLPVSATQAGDGRRAAAHRPPGQDLVPEPKDEIQEGAQGQSAGRADPVVRTPPPLLQPQLMCWTLEVPGRMCCQNILLLPFARSAPHGLRSCVIPPRLSR